MDAIAGHLGYPTVGWEVNTADRDPATTAEAIHQRVMGQVHDGAIGELHLDVIAGTANNAVALPWIIDDLRAQGYHFVTIPEMTRPC